MVAIYVYVCSYALCIFHLRYVRTYKVYVVLQVYVFIQSIYSVFCLCAYVFAVVVDTVCVHGMYVRNYSYVITYIRTWVHDIPYKYYLCIPPDIRY